MATNIILTETIDTIGIIGTEATVADGYARNYLLPQGKAVLATENNRKQLALKKAAINLQIAKEKEMAVALAEKVEGIVCRVEAKVSRENKLYGSISANDIIGLLKDQGIEVEKRMLLNTEPIKEAGTYKIGIRLYTDVEPNITLEVVGEAKPEKE